MSQCKCNKSVFKYSVNTNSIRAFFKPAEMAAMFKKLGYEGVEWGLPGVADAAAAAQEMDRAAKDHGLEVVGYINAGHLWKTDVMRKWSEAVAAVGGRHLRVSPPWAAYDFAESLHQKASFTDMMKICRDGLAGLVPLAREYGIRYVVELHKGNVAVGAAEARLLADGIDPKAVGFIYDAANTATEGFLRPRHSVELLGEYMAYVHLKNLVLEPTADGEDPAPGVRRLRYTARTTKLNCGLVDWVEVMFGLKTVGWSGWLSMEEFFDRRAPEKDLAEALAFIKACEAAAPCCPQPPFTAFND